MKLTKRKGFNFFRSYYDVYNELNDKDKVAFMDALLDRQFLGVKPKGLKGMAKFAFISQTNSIDSQVKGYEDKTKTRLDGTPYDRVSTPPTEGGSETPTKQEKEKEEVKEKLTIKDRKRNFSKLLTLFLEKYSKEMLNDFYGYWTEHGVNDRKMRFEKEKSFSVERRLTTWAKNQKKFDNKPTAQKSEKRSAADIIFERNGLS